ncbi:MAG TPA: hypothetical protein VMC09_05330, partial [Anaerolineales bacterium]|nr:hypothetical protein [Anaerolineales bacterium]
MKIVASRLLGKPSYHKVLVAVCLVAPLVVFGAAAVLADYIGPKNRVGPDQIVCSEIYRYKTGPYQGQVACSMPCGEPEYYQAMCGAACQTGCNDSQQYTTIPGPNLPDATISAGPVACSLAGSNGWCRGSASLTLTGTEPVSGYQITAIEGKLNGATPFLCSGASCTLALPEGQDDLTFWALSSFGDSSLMGSASAKVDSVAPALNATLTGTVGLDGWFVSDVHIGIAPTDASSGVA